MLGQFLQRNSGEIWELKEETGDERETVERNNREEREIVERDQRENG